MNIILNTSSMVPIYEQLVLSIKNDILGGALKTGDILPSVRTLSAELKISALTVKKAYDRLESDGFVTTIHGKGTFVAVPDAMLALEMRRKTVEDELDKAIVRARTYGFTAEEISEMVSLLLEIG